MRDRRKGEKMSEGKARTGQVSVSFWVPEEFHKALRIKLAERGDRKPLSKVLIELLNNWLEEGK